MYKDEEKSHYYIDTLTKEFGRKQEDGKYLIDSSDCEGDDEEIMIYDNYIPNQSNSFNNQALC